MTHGQLYCNRAPALRVISWLWMPCVPWVSSGDAVRNAVDELVAQTPDEHLLVLVWQSLVRLSLHARMPGRMRPNDDASMLEQFGRNSPLLQIKLIPSRMTARLSVSGGLYRRQKNNPLIPGRSWRW